MLKLAVTVPLTDPSINLLILLLNFKIALLASTVIVSVIVSTLISLDIIKVPIDLADCLYI